MGRMCPDRWLIVAARRAVIADEEAQKDRAGEFDNFLGCDHIPEPKR